MNIRKATGALAATAGLAFVMWAAPALGASSPNYGQSYHPTLFDYYGYVQCQPSYVEAKKHAARAWMRFTIDGYADTGLMYTSAGYGPTDSRIYSRYEHFVDSVDPNAAVTEFTYGFDWVPVNSPWPFSLNPEIS